MSLGMKTVAKDILGQFGTLVEIRTITRTEDRDAGTSSESVATQSVRAAIDRFRQELIDGAAVKSGDKQATISAEDLDSAPDPADMRVRSLGVTYAVLGVEPIIDGDEVAAYTLHLRPA